MMIGSALVVDKPRALLKPASNTLFLYSTQLAGNKPCVLMASDTLGKVHSLLSTCRLMPNILISDTFVQDIASLSWHTSAL